MTLPPPEMPEARLIALIQQQEAQGRVRAARLPVDEPTAAALTAYGADRVTLFVFNRRHLYDVRGNLVTMGELIAELAPLLWPTAANQTSNGLQRAGQRAPGSDLTEVQAAHLHQWATIAIGPLLPAPRGATVLHVTPLLPSHLRASHEVSLTTPNGTYMSDTDRPADVLLGALHALLPKR
ncbi:hypothetical protein [Deinococcus hopiensis]|uniref:Uncharacterized protein n=1 Tax=Deinococcus hopiensis KR-140 TaxID=695939 RepID=A0A1W1UTT6_9DEIO|nr:hypothetical protein [Deinococcus hopiensis]SMB84517.1 hypothetical protein SAMN00790413_05171 [Deinococcus hopiensis KR-140]